MAISKAQKTKALADLLTGSLRLTELVDPLEALLEECTTSAELECIQSLLSRFEFIDPMKMETLLDKLYSEIAALAAHASNPAIAAIAPNSEKDSSQKVLYDLVSIDARNMIFSERSVFNNINAVRTKRENHDLIFLIDTFCATGKTIKSRIQSLGGAKIVACFPVIMRQAAKGLHVKGIAYLSPLHLDRGISDLADTKLATRFVTAMKRIEGRLSPAIEGKPLPSFGYGHAESIVEFRRENLPNSVFPVFWWRNRLDGKRRNTLFHRRSP